mgnify:CR=1 FL=1
MRFWVCHNTEKQTSTIYEVVNKKPVKVTAHPLSLPKYEPARLEKLPAQSYPTRTASGIFKFEEPGKK